MRFSGSGLSRRRYRLIGLLIVVVLIASLVPVVGCAKKQTVQGKTLRVAFSATPDAIDVVGYKMMDILKNEGINVDYGFYDGGAKAIQALMAGQVDIAASSLEDIVATGMTVFALNRPKNIYAMVGAKGMTKVEDIKGKKLGAADPDSIANVIAEAIFAKHGIKHDDLTWVQIGGSGARTSALLAGKVDAVFVYGGKHIQLKQAGYPTLTTMQDEFPGLHDDMWCSTKDWLAANEDLAVAVCKAQIEAARWFHDKPDEWLALAKEKVEGLDDAVARQTYELFKGMDMYPVDGLMTERTLQTTADFLIQAGIIDNVPLESWATTKYMDQARRELGVTVK